MKKTNNRRLFTSVAAPILFTLAVCAAIVSGFAFAPDLVSYTVSTKESVSDKISAAQKCLYNDYSEIVGDGPFEIRCEKENIYVFKDNVRLYRIKTPLERLTGADVSRMHDGIIIQTSPELYELIQHIES